MSSKPVSEFYFLKILPMWQYFKGEHFSFWMICCYLFFEYTRPQAIFPSIDVLPWAQLFLIFSMAGALVDKSVKWVSHPVNIVLIFFAIVIYFSSVFAYYPHLSSKKYIDFYGWFVIYFLVINIVNTEKRYYLFLMIFILCSAKIAIGTSKSWVFRGFSFTSWGLKGPPGYFANSGELSILMLTFFPVSLGLYFYLKDKVSKYEKWILLVFWVTPIMTITGASSRGSQLALAVLLAVIFRKSLLKVKPLIGVIVLGGALFFLLPEEQKDRFRSAGEDKTSVQRLLYWKNGWEMIKEHPVLGVGYFNFAPYYEVHYPQDMLYEHAELPHNIFIQVGTDAGFLGLLPFLTMLALALRVGYRMSKKVNVDPLIAKSAIGMSYGVLGFIIAGQFVTVTYYPFFWVNLAFLVAAENVCKNKGNSVKA